MTWAKCFLGSTSKQIEDEQRVRLILKLWCDNATNCMCQEKWTLSSSRSLVLKAVQHGFLGKCVLEGLEAKYAPLFDLLWFLGAFGQRCWWASQVVPSRNFLGPEVCLRGFSVYLQLLQWCFPEMRTQNLFEMFKYAISETDYWHY